MTEPFFKTDATMNSAGGHLATLHDLARWTIVQTDSGVIDGRRVFPAEAVALSHRLIARQTRDQAKRFAFFDREGWGAGWDIGTYEGERMVSRFGELSRHAVPRVVPAGPPHRCGGHVVGWPLRPHRHRRRLCVRPRGGAPRCARRAEERLAELRTAVCRRRERTSRRRTRLAPRASCSRWGGRSPDFAGAYEEPSFGRVTFTVQDGRLEYRWGALYGPAEIYDAAKGQLRIEIAGAETVVTFAFAGPGPARSLEVQGVTFPRAQ